MSRIHCQGATLLGDATWEGAHPKIVRFRARPGLYQLSVRADGREFNWDSLHEVLNKWGNSNVRTGPWDFSINHANTPLVPAFRVTLDQRPLGLWFFQRVSLQNIEKREFQGRCAFWIREEGEHEIGLTAFQERPLPWKEMRLEPDPIDTLDESAWRLPANAQTIARLRGELLPKPPPGYLHEPLREVRAWCLAETFAPSANSYVHPPASLFPALVLGRQWNDPALKARGREMVEKLMDAPGWGNPHPDGYGHNCDKSGAAALSLLARAWHLLEAEESALRGRIFECIRERGRIFVDLVLLNRDYWGGSVLQDHGWDAIHRFAECVLWMSKDMPEAAEWSRHIIPRARQAFAAMPRDGVIPLSSYASLTLYADPLIWLRELLREAGAGDPYEEYPFPEVIDYLHAVMDADRQKMMIHCPGESDVAAGGLGFYAQFLQGSRRQRASALLKAALKTAPEKLRSGITDLWLLAADEPDFKAGFPGRPPFQYYADSALVLFGNASEGTFFTLRCGPWNGSHAWEHAGGPCDRMAIDVGAGHFSLTVKGDEVFLSPDAGYAIRSVLRSCLLIDDQGQRGDIGYPMSIPDFDLPMGQILRAEAISDGCEAELELGAAYDRAQGVQSYRRLFHVHSNRLEIADLVRLDHPRSLSWLFQTTKDHLIAMEEHGIRLQAGTVNVCLTAESPEIRLEPRLIPTPVVYSYSARKDKLPFAHARFNTVRPVDAIEARFVIAW